MATLRCPCGEVYHVDRAAPVGAKILCRVCRRVLSAEDAIAAPPADAASNTTRARKVKGGGTVILPVAASPVVRLRAWLYRLSERFRRGARRS
jgi:hypothetical protein